MEQQIIISKKEFDDIVIVLEWIQEHPEFFECNCEPHYERDTNAAIHADECSCFMDDHVDITLANLKARTKGFYETLRGSYSRLGFKLDDNEAR